MVSVKRITISSLKGGTGKSTSTVNLGKALRRANYTVGLLDVDATAPTLHKALGLSEAPHWGLDSASAKFLPFEVDGLYALTLASHYGENPAVLWDEPTLIRAMKELLRDIVWPESLDYLLLDSPPSSSGFMQALYDQMGKDLYGIVLVFQPTDIAVADLIRTLDFVKIKKVPILGLVANMSYCVSPKGESFWPFLSPKVDLGSVCQEHGIPLLGEVPLTPSQERIDRIFDDIAKQMEAVKPVVLKDSIFMRLYKALARKAVQVGIEVITRRH